jgi:hypothetical protein
MKNKAISIGSLLYNQARLFTLRLPYNADDFLHGMPLRLTHVVLVHPGICLRAHPLSRWAKVRQSLKYCEIVPQSRTPCK